MKKFFTKVLSLVLVLFLVCGLFACGEDPIDYAHTIIFYHTQGDPLQQKTAIAIQAFEEKYPGWKVIQTQIGGYDDVRDKVISDLQGHIQPDLAYCYSDHVAAYLKTGKVLDMASLINSTETIDAVIGGVTTPVQIGYTAEELADFVPGYYAEGFATNYGGYKTYGFNDDSILTLPFSKSTELLYVNKTALIGAGITNEDGTAKVATTWEELWAQAEILVETYPTAIPLGYDSEANWFITMCEQNGWGYTSADDNQHYLFNNSDAIAWLDQLAEYYNKGYITTQEEYGSYTSNLFVKGVDDGGIVYCIGSSGGASHQSSDLFEWGVYPIPGSSTSTASNPNACISQGPSLVMFQTERSENVDEKAKMTFLFVKELLDPTFQASFSIQSGYNPVRISTAEVDAYIEHMEGDKITATAAKVAASLSDRFFSSPAFVGSTTARQQVQNALVYALTGTKSGEKALRDAYANCGGK